jgi:diguanylate cyclase (GGDEF)-like protein
MIKNFFIHFFDSPENIKNKHKIRVSKLVYVTSILIFVYTIVEVPISIITGAGTERNAIWVLALFGLLQIPAYLLARAGYINLVSSFLLGMGWVVAFYFARTLAGLHDTGIFIFIGLMLGSAIMVSWWALTGFTILSIASFWWLAFLQDSGKLVPLLSSPYNTAIDFTLTFLLIFAIIFFFVRVLSNALKDAEREMAERIKAEEELKKQAITDFLTGLFNRRYFFTLGSKEFSKSIRYHRPMSIAMFDIDFFKKVNDRYGHEAGDEVLISLSKNLKLNSRESDIFARYGGEEFIILMPETDCEQSFLAAERFRKIVQDTPIQVGEDMINITVSIGISSCGELDTIKSIDELISKADQALYQAKRTGRNRCVCYENL